LMNLAKLTPLEKSDQGQRYKDSRDTVSYITL
jgi:hypothetical protein